MRGLKKSRSYPETIRDSHIREFNKEKLKLQKTIDKFRVKDYNSAQHLADLDSPSSRDVIIHKTTCWDVISNIVNYFLEREEKSRLQDNTIRKKSYAGFYYFIKWFVRSLFFLIFTTLGSVAGKEIGCEIKDKHNCKTGVIELAGNSPHIVSTITGSIFGLIIGQWVGRVIWDKLTLSIRRCLRCIEKRADRTKALLLLTSAIVYVVVTSLFSVIFYFFVRVNNDNIIGAIVGGCVGMILAILAYHKSSSCTNGQISETPMIVGSVTSENLPELIL